VPQAPDLELDGFREVFADRPLDPALAAAVRGALASQAARPFAVPARAFGAALARAIAAEVDPVQALASLAVDDLALATACVEGDRAALDLFAREHLARIPEFVRKVDASAPFGDDARQAVAAKLLGTVDAPGKLALYTGRGPLGAFVRVAAVRHALNQKRDERGTSPEPDLDAMAGAAHASSADLEVLKSKHADDVRRALAHAVGSLDPPDRLALRLHYVDGLSLEEVGRACRVSRATAARMLSRARWHVRGELQRELELRLRGAVGDSTLDVLVGDSLAESLARMVKDPG